MKWLALLLERIFYATFWLLGAGVYWTPFAVRRRIVNLLAWLWFHGVRFRRRIILHNVARVFPRKPEEPMALFKERCESLALDNMRHTLHNLFEIFERFHWSKKLLGRRIFVHGWENVEKLTAVDQGFFFLTAHLGNWELISLVGKLKNLPLAIITKHLRNSFFDTLWVQSRKRYGLELLKESGSGLGIARAIQKGRCVGFILDQHTGEPHGIESTFLGLSAWCPKGLAILSTRLHCPIVPAYILRQEDGTFVVTLEAPLSFPLLEKDNSELRTESGALTDAGIRYHIELCNANIEQWIRKAPTQYLWMHRRFKNIVDYRALLPWEL